MVGTANKENMDPQNFQSCPDSCRVPPPCCGKCPYLQQDSNTVVEEPVSYYHIGLLGATPNDPKLASKLIREIMYMRTFNQPSMDREAIVVRIHSYEMELVVAENFENLIKSMSISLNGIILFYSIDDKHGFENVALQWIPNLKMLYPSIPLFLCATGIEQRLIVYDIMSCGSLRIIRKNCCQKHVASQLAEKFSKKYGLTYEEISVKTKEGIEDLFNDILSECIVREAEMQKLAKTLKKGKR